LAQERTVLPAEEDERLDLALAHLQPADRADNDQVVARLVLRVNRALDPSESVVERGTCRAVVPGDAGEAVDAEA
jgi:hypothetical protein